MVSHFDNFQLTIYYGTFYSVQRLASSFGFNSHILTMVVRNCLLPPTRRIIAIPNVYYEPVPKDPRQTWYFCSPRTPRRTRSASSTQLWRHICYQHLSSHRSNRNVLPSVLRRKGRHCSRKLCSNLLHLSNIFVLVNDFVFTSRSTSAGSICARNEIGSGLSHLYDPAQGY